MFLHVSVCSERGRYVSSDDHWVGMSRGVGHIKRGYPRSHRRPTRPWHRHIVGRYVSYWNVFLCYLVWIWSFWYLQVQKGDTSNLLKWLLQARKDKMPLQHICGQAMAQLIAKVNLKYSGEIKKCHVNDEKNAHIKCSDSYSRPFFFWGDIQCSVITIRSFNV